MERPQDAIPGIFRPPPEWVTDPKAVARAASSILNAADERSAPMRRTAIQLVDHFTLHALPLPPAVRTALAKVMRVTRIAATRERKHALARGEDIDVGSRSKRRLRGRPAPAIGTRNALWNAIEEHAERGEPLPSDVWWAVAERLKVSPPRRRQRLVDVRKTSESDGEFVWKDKPPEKRHGRRYRDKDRQRAMDIEARARIVRARHDVQALPYPVVARLANVLDEYREPAAEVVKTWGSSQAWKLGTSGTSIHLISNGIEQGAAAMMRGHTLTAEELAAWVRVEPAIIKAWRREISPVEVANLIDRNALEGDALVKVVEGWWEKDEPWSQRVRKRYTSLHEDRRKYNSHLAAGRSSGDIINIGHESRRTRKTQS